ncbi:glycosyltransferase family 4 protein [Fibrella forsythiae]|uniref:Undecaprenyl/decaprenyl-phosphate alpha-N-acetylglucosaminyl 1-phosphate transferase n=1 Tax=Fibrella forsythiae TaxID=2817061 RepID=A0ABS3JJP6_9BACT|nr:MraY family glycosyltransferase [Fibrella forsythiae]MBO0949651.1 undecaprenyl/decaprenyl-phosphate alpha-N-acetylglucosaminyl 1-phosphate transferase [Fibrella forsythiae]
MLTNVQTTASLFYGIAIALLLCWMLLPLLIRLSPLIGLVDRPNDRKVHHQSIPAIGGLTIGLTVIGTAIIYAPLQALFWQHIPLAVALVILLATGVIDDRLNIRASLRLFIQVSCAVAVAHHGIRLTSLHGLFGINELSLVLQYGLTVLILTGMANAFNLIDGIDGLAGSLALINMVLFSTLAVFFGQRTWLALLLPVVGALLAFLKYNWRPARLFMGDGGSVVLGFLIAVLGIVFVERAYQDRSAYVPQVVALVMASCMIPVLDALRVFANRISKGQSPFLADKNHMHHWLLKHRLAHSQITVRMAGIHVTLLLLSLVISVFFSISLVVIVQVGVVFAYTGMMQLSHSFLTSYRLVKLLASG